MATPQICLNMQQKKNKKHKKENLRTDESRREKPPDPAARRESLVAVRSQGLSQDGSRYVSNLNGENKQWSLAMVDVMIYFQYTTLFRR